jgi:hypothetical protein
MIRLNTGAWRVYKTRGFGSTKPPNQSKGESLQDLNGIIIGSIGSQSGVKNGRPWTRFDIPFSDGKVYSTFKPEIATKATQLQGSPVSIRVTVKQTGDFTNFYLDDVAPEGQLPDAPENPSGMTTSQVGNTQGVISTPNFSSQNGDDGKRRSKEQIARESALIAAFSYPGEASVAKRYHLAEEIYETAIKGFDPDELTTSEEVASTVPEVDVGTDRVW